MSILINQPGGGFAPAVDVIVGLAPSYLDVGDITGDGVADLLVVNETSNNVSVLANNGAGVFSPLATIPVGAKPYSIHLGHLNGDNLLDFVVANRDSNSVSVVLANGAGAFAAPVHRSTPADPRFAVIGDFDDDGDNDVAVASQDPFGNVRILANDGAANFSTLIDFPLPIELQPERMRVADFDCDGADDLAFANSREDNGNVQLTGTLSVLITRGAGSFLGPLDYGVGREPVGLAVADWDRDGDIDVLSADRSSNQVSLLRNLTCAQRIIGDMNCDGVVSVSDIGGFVLALTDPVGYGLTFPDCSPSNADANGDGFVTVSDIGPFIALLTG